MQIEKVVISSNKEIAFNIWEMRMEAPGIVSACKGAGEFINILATNGWYNPLRRPMSIASSDGSTLSIIYKIFGEVTAELADKKIGDALEVLGPLGNTFTRWKDGYHPVLVAGGVGLAPILHLQSNCNQFNIKNSMVIGARSKNEHFIDHDPKQNIYLSTDDGTLGESGTVMPTLDRIVKEVQNPYIFACGPEPMLRAVRDYSIKYNVPTQISVESYMGCGVGLCQGCVISRNLENTQVHSYHQKYSLVCVDGPVYEAEDIHFD